MVFYGFHGASPAEQEVGQRFVVDVDGSESNVIGLPIDETLALLRAVGVTPELAGGTP